MLFLYVAKNSPKNVATPIYLDNYATLFDYLKTYHLMGEGRHLKVTRGA
eukprot:CAMPEP_0172481410 /NCGR_PEP_ID=MMETSP1066-20121228/7228_1 /TAXON_ID=671091 /ORGANISM="Coscinodiscus wailesii, Strain CCMP2513" /LENGTH=48 /DNA_ID= /DNA_START= /DNA_END= /DNA_ORIENTATION=